MILDLTDEETAVLIRELTDITFTTRYQLSPRIKTLMRHSREAAAEAGSRTGAAGEAIRAAIEGPVQETMKSDLGPIDDPHSPPRFTGYYGSVDKAWGQVRWQQPRSICIEGEIQHVRGWIMFEQAQMFKLSRRTAWNG